MYKGASSSNMQGPRKREGTGGWSGDGNTQFNNGILKKNSCCFQIVTCGKHRKNVLNELGIKQSKIFK